MTSGHENKAFDGDSEVTISHHENPSKVGVSQLENQLDIPERKPWDSKWEFLMSCISLSVGLGNVWRFPVTAYENGGGAFLIPYLIVLVFIGRPIYFLELTVGQFTSFSQIKVWSCAPILKGVGYGSLIATLSILTYYVSIMGLTVYYFVSSFQKTLPWAQCDTVWAGDFGCKGKESNTTQSLSEMFFLNYVIKEADNIEHGIGLPDWKLVLCLLFSWILIFGIQYRGVQSAGKVAYFTAIFPYVIMLILLIRGVTLDGAVDGIVYFVKPVWSKLLDPNVWYAAVSQCFFSLNTGTGALIMFGSYNPFTHNVYHDALVVSLMDTFTSLLAGFTIFAVLGNLAHELNQPVEKVVKGGAGLAFISYPEAIAKFEWVPQLFAVLFFLMLFTLGIGSAVSDAGAIVTVFCDRFPKLIRWQVTAAICTVGFGVGVVYTTPGGLFINDLVDFFGGGFVIYTTSALEVVGIAWIYGLYNYIDDIEFMLNIKLGWYWKMCWGLLIPIFLTIVLVYSLVQDISPKHNDLAYPVIALGSSDIDKIVLPSIPILILSTVCGWLISATALFSIPVGGIQSTYLSEGSTWSEKFKNAWKPSKRWGPMNPKTRAAWTDFKESRPPMSLKERMKQRKL